MSISATNIVQNPHDWTKLIVSKANHKENNVMMFVFC